VTSLPDWLVERAALDEVAPHSRDRIERADRGELEARIAALRAENAAELAAHPAAPAVAQIQLRVAKAHVDHRVVRQRKRRILVVGVMSAATIAIVLVAFARKGGERSVAGVDEIEETRAKGATRLVVFRQVGDHAERLDEDELVREGDLLQLRYRAGGRGYGVIASVDGAGVVTLHFPQREDAAPEATALAQKTTSLPNAYALDDAPKFERFFFITADEPINVEQTLQTLRAHAQRGDSATASLEIPANHRQWSLRLRKPSNQKSP
jgi:hypothetical protein